MSRKQLIGDIADGDLQATHGIGPRERLMGLAWSTTLAAAIKRLRASTRKFRKPSEPHAMPASALHRTVTALAATHKALPNSKSGGMTIDDREKLALIVILEAVSPLCTTCNGRRELHVPGRVVIQCGACQGSGMRRYTDADRARIMGRCLSAIEVKVLEQAQSLFLHHDSLGETLTSERIYGVEV